VCNFRMAVSSKSTKIGTNAFVDCAEEQEGPAQTESAGYERLW